MANLTDERLKEMEEEMNRFEEEILTQQDDDDNSDEEPVTTSTNKRPLDASTLARVQAQLADKIFAPPPPPPPTTAASPSKPALDALPKKVLAAAFVPPPPPPPESQIGPKLPESTFQGPRMAPPPPPPPGFLPPQLRHRPPMPPPPPRAPIPPIMMRGIDHSGPRMMPMPPVPPHLMNRPPMGPPGPFPPRPMVPPMGMPVQTPPMHMHMPPTNYSYPQPQINCPTSVAVSSEMQQQPKQEPPKVIYSAPALRKSKDDKGSGSSVTTDFSVSKPSNPGVTMPGGDAAPAGGGGGVEVPMEMMDGEKKQNSGATSSSNAGQSADAGAQGGNKKDKKDKKRKFVRMAAGTAWEDQTLADWDQDDFRLFAGDLGNEVTDDILIRAFNKYPSFLKAKVVRDKRTNKTKGYGFVSFKDPNDFSRAMKEMNGKYVGNRPIKLRKSVWQDRQIDAVKRKEREKKRLGFR